MWIMIAGPCKFGASSAAERQRNLDRLNDAAMAVFEKGRVPIIGVSLALSIIGVAEDGRLDEIMMPLSLALVERCDACLRTGGPSNGADRERDAFAARGLPVFESPDDTPQA